MATKKSDVSKDEQVGFHKGALATLAKEREEMMKILQIVEQLMQMHLKALKYKREEIDVYLVNSSLGSLGASGTLISGYLPDLEVELGDTEPIISVTYIGEQLSSHPEIFLREEFGKI